MNERDGHIKTPGAHVGDSEMKLEKTVAIDPTFYFFYFSLDR